MLSRARPLLLRRVPQGKIMVRADAGDVKAAGSAA